MRNSMIKVRQFCTALACAALFYGNVCKAEGEPSTSVVNPCENTEGWRTPVCQFVRTNLVHLAWGYEHCLRDYSLAKNIAAAEGVPFDDDVLFAASMLHDLGGFPDFSAAGVDHAVRSTEVVDSILLPAGFPSAKLEAVKAAIRSHSYYDPIAPTSAEGILLHDADGLDFLGSIAAMRIIAIAGKDRAAPTVKSAVTLLSHLQQDVPRSLIGGTYTQSLGSRRGDELRHFLETLHEESFEFGIPQ